ncbi:TPA: prolyl oligopeptidase family serine peptidase [Streptococcus suis]
MQKNSKEFLETIQEKKYYKDCVYQSFQELKGWKSLKFRKGDYWYQYDNWDLPHRGIIKEWMAKDNDWIPKVKSKSQTFNVILNVEECLIPDGYILQDVRLSPIGNYIVLVLSSLQSINLIGIEKYTMEKIFEIENIAMESSFYLGKYGIMFSRCDKNGRPSKLFYKELQSSDEKLLFEEDKQSFRIKIMYADDNSCFVKSSNFFTGQIHLYIFKNSGFDHYSFSPSICTIPRDLALLSFEGSTYYVAIYSDEEGKDFINFTNIVSEEVITVPIPYQERTRRVHWICGRVLLDCSNESHSLFYYIDFSSKEMSAPKFTRILFDRKTTIYENSYSTQKLLFLENETFYEKILSYDFSNSTLKKEVEIPILKTNQTKYHTKLIWAEGKGVNIPITLFWKSDQIDKFPKNSKCILSVYGAYGKNDSTKLDQIMLSIINAGFVYAVVHVRGGGYLGGDWYRQGKGLNKWNSITDFIDSVHYLIKHNIVDSQKLGLLTSSAGGIIAGATLNEQNNLLKSILLFSPFINPYDTLQNPNDPLSKTEISEWGDIRNPIVKDYIKSYSPMQNVKKATGSKSIVINILGGKDPYINNEEVLEWSNKLKDIGVKSLLYYNNKAGHGGLTSLDDYLIIDTLSYFLEIVGGVK